MDNAFTRIPQNISKDVLRVFKRTFTKITLGLRSKINLIQILYYIKKEKFVQRIRI
jgi:hypothetical protein